MSNTSEQYDNVIVKCTEIFKKKTIDYGTAWRILRSSSLTWKPPIEFCTYLGEKSRGFLQENIIIRNNGKINFFIF